MGKLFNVIGLSLLMVGCSQANAQDSTVNKPSQEILEQVESIENNVDLTSQEKVNELTKLMSQDSSDYGNGNGEYHVTPNTETIQQAINRLK